MTHHEKLVERYEDALFALMMEDVAETEGESCRSLMNSLNAIRRQKFQGSWMSAVFAQLGLNSERKTLYLRDVERCEFLE